MHDKVQAELQEANRKNKVLNEEHDKLRERLKNYKSRYRMMGAQDLKYCKNCGKEYIELENYNWSCRTHKSQWNDEIYFCCGKTVENTPGCKYSKHECKEDEDDLEGKDSES